MTFASVLPTFLSKLVRREFVLFLTEVKWVFRPAPERLMG